jgi:tRNA-Thr(GGU) m(6)t(6)A37 methyltransferase TsaA
MTPTEDILLHPIGHVETTVADEDIPRRRRDIVSDVVIAERYRDALAGIEAYSHLFVLFWMHRVPRDAERLMAHPRGDPTLPLTGVLAARGRNRPNPIGLAVVDLIARRGTRLTVRRLDAYHGTPVVDLKPYDHLDVFPDLREPEWLRRRGSA